MRVSNGVVYLSPTDLSSFLGCRHRVGLDLAVALGVLDAPRYIDPRIAALQQRGEAHERQFVESLGQQGSLVDLRGDDEAARRTLEAMRAGVDAIAQARLEHRRWMGYVDVLRRNATPSALGEWSYEVWDTKLARETRGGTVLQLSAYSDLLSTAQGRLPEHFHVVTPDPVTPVHTYRVDEFAAYYRFIRNKLELAVAEGADLLQALHYPEPVEHCDVCRWFRRCDARRRADDHLSLVAGMTRLHRTELTSRDIRTVEAAASVPLPIPFRPSRGARRTYERLREQARVQVEQRTTGLPVHETLAVTAGEGFHRLPAPTPSDLFLDLEGDLFARDKGREYLFGLLSRREDASTEYRRWWAFDDSEERAAFEAVVDAIDASWSADPHMHVYHFGHYEPTALKRLMGRYATREAAIDRLLRAGRFVDLHTILRQAVRAGVESYSLKQLEAFHGFTRDMSLRDVAPHKLFVELALESNAPDTISGAARDAVEAYNRDDCRSTLALLEWLERLRAEVEADGTVMARPPDVPAEPPRSVSDMEAQVERLRARLLEAVPDTPADRNPEQQARWLLAWLLDWHRRESRAEWWEYYRLRDLPEDDLLDEARAVAGLQFQSETRQVKKSFVHRYAFPEQELEIGAGAELKLQDERKFGEVVAVDRAARTIDILKGPTRRALHPTAVFEHTSVSTTELQKSLLRTAELFLEHGFEAANPAADLLLQRPPRLTSRLFERRAGESVDDFCVRAGLELDGCVLAIQGPPGAGKTYLGAEMICALVAAGRRVGVTAVSHKVIRNLLHAVARAADRRRLEVRLTHKVDTLDDRETAVVEVTTNKELLDPLSEGRSHVAGATPFLWAREEAAAAVDVLVVDEAGQMSLANVLASAQAAGSVVLLGDPQQLEQPQKGSHPDGVDVSALDHVLAGAKTMPPDRGIFLPTTWRLAPDICGFTSEVFYERRLEPKAGLERQRLIGTGRFDGAGLWWVPLEHDGNRNFSNEEVEVVDRIVRALVSTGAQWIDERGTAHALAGEAVLIVAPFNAQVNRLQERLGPLGVCVGTVDKFQGQEAPVVIYSMATSRPEDAPRGMEFLYSLNRLNVATSRARCAGILVASPRLLEPECRTPRQMQMANALCRFVELARAVAIG